jgi:hypothetical protein
MTSCVVRPPTVDQSSFPVLLLGSIQQQEKSFVSLNAFKAANGRFSLEFMAGELRGAKAL